MKEILDPRLKELVEEAQKNRLDYTEAEGKKKELNNRFDAISHEAQQYFNDDVNQFYNLPGLGLVKLEIKPCFTIKDKNGMIEELKADESLSHFIEEGFNEKRVKGLILERLIEDGILPFKEGLISQYDKPILKFKKGATK